ncbi:nuclear receptor-interacting protein 2 isoform X2 [Hoplias malabaricus]|uniref:nuclear receptor-interacting protein 2 isoform X2 n=1 Tax=Hoplias malabaricus TaxID=27720 RepID=UPI003461E733
MFNLSQPHSIVQRRLLEGNIPRLRGDARDPLSRVRSPLADTKDGGETEERSESTVDDSTEERESPEESERSLRSEEEEEEDGDQSDAWVKTEMKQKGGERATEREKARGQVRTEARESAPTLSGLLVQCKCGDAEVKVSISTSCQYNHISSKCCRRLGLKASPESGHLSDSKVNMTSVLLQFGKERVQCSAQVIDDEVFELRLGLHTLLELKCCLDLHNRVLRLYSTGEELPFLKTTSHCHHHDDNKNL